MSAQAGVANLRKQLEQLFPGKWLTAGGQSDVSHLLRTGIAEIDRDDRQGSYRSFARRRISQWTGTYSSGKTTLLRSAVAYWCLSGLNVAYIDTFSRLVAFDWASVDRGLCGALPLGTLSALERADLSDRGQFVVLRSSFLKDSLKEAFWATEQFIASAVFDVVIFDMASVSFISDRAYARLQRVLDRSKAALILLRDDFEIQGKDGGWGCHTNIGFKWSASFECQEGVAGTAMILPSVEGYLRRDGLSRNMEIKFTANVTNRLFTHPQPPDRRTSKARARA